MNTTTYVHTTEDDAVQAEVLTVSAGHLVGVVRIGSLSIMTPKSDTLGQAVENLKALRLSIDRAVRDACNAATDSTVVMVIH